MPSNSGGRSLGLIFLIVISVSSSRAPAGMSNVSLPSELVIVPPSGPIKAFTILNISSSLLLQESTEKTEIEIENAKNIVSFFMVKFPHLYRIYGICIFLEVAGKKL